MGADSLLGEGSQGYGEEGTRAWMGNGEGRGGGRERGRERREEEEEEVILNLRD